ALVAIQVFKRHAVDRQYIIERLQVVAANLAGAPVVRYPVLAQHSQRSTMCRLPNMPPANTRRVDADFVRQPGFGDKVAHDGFGHRATTDIALTDKQHTDHRQPHYSSK